MALNLGKPERTLLSLEDQGGTGEGWHRVGPAEKSENLLPLHEFVAALRAELLTAHEEGPAGGDAETGPRFVVGPVNVEFTVTAKREAGGNGSIKFYVFQFGASVSVATESTQRVSLTLTPLTEDGEPYEVSSRLLDKPK